MTSMTTTTSPTGAINNGPAVDTQHHCSLKKKKPKQQLCWNPTGYHKLNLETSRWYNVNKLILMMAQERTATNLALSLAVFAWRYLWQSSIEIAHRIKNTNLIMQHQLLVQRRKKKKDGSNCGKNPIKMQWKDVLRINENYQTVMNLAQLNQMGNTNKKKSYLLLKLKKYLVAYIHIFVSKKSIIKCV